MQKPVKINYTIQQGATFKRVLRWESSTKHYALITAITKSAPVVITAPAHGCPVGWRARVTNVVGMKEINSEEYFTVTDATQDTVTVNLINSLGYTAYASNGVLEYNEPVDLTGYTAVMQARDSATGEIVMELTTENSGIVFDNVEKTITLTLDYNLAKLLTFKTAEYGIEFTKSGEVIPFSIGVLTLEKERVKP